MAQGLLYCLLCVVWHHGGMGGTMCPDDPDETGGKGGMVSGGGFEYIVIRPGSTVVSRPEAGGRIIWEEDNYLQSTQYALHAAGFKGDRLEDMISKL